MQKLTATAVKQAKPKTKPYKLADGGGLYLSLYYLSLQDNCQVPLGKLIKYLRHSFTGINNKSLVIIACAKGIILRLAH